MHFGECLIGCRANPEHAPYWSDVREDGDGGYEVMPCPECYPDDLDITAELPCVTMAELVEARL